MCDWQQSIMQLQSRLFWCFLLAGLYTNVKSDSVSSCPLGAYQTGNNSCSLCIPGTYGSSTGLTVCTRCHAGTVQTGRGMIDSARCMACTAGTYQTGEGIGAISGCIRCSEGAYQTGFGMAMLSDCIPCQAGTFQPTLGQTFAAACLPCQKGRYQTGTGMVNVAQCVSCSAGTFQSAIGAISVENCTLCQPGSFLSGMGATHSRNCTLCPAGTFQTGLGAINASNCSLCLAGTFETGVGNSQTLCTRCRAGTYLTGLGFSSAGECVGCGPGTYQTGMGYTSSSQCIRCVSGTFLTETGANRAASCQACGAGTYQTGIGATSGQNCTPCEAGGYQTGIGITSQAGCIRCSAGTYQSVVGASAGQSCILCKEGTYQPRLGGDSLLSCIQCARGTYQSGVGVTAMADCLKCTVGVIQTSMGATSQAWCTPCSAGTYSSIEGAGAVENCTRCSQGNYQTGLGASSAQACVHCEQGKVQPISSTRTTSAECLACGPGTYASSPDAGTCEPCAAGTFQTGLMQSNCSRCRRGTFLPFTGVRYESWCAPCERGTYQSVMGGSSLDSCIKCRKGAFASETGGVSACTSCSAGTYTSYQGAQLCPNCPSGTYTSQTEADRCDACSSGTYGNHSGQTGCLQCRPGYFQGSNGSSACLVCPPGAFQTGNGGSTCTLCIQGKYHPLTAQTSPEDCRNCSAGSYGAEAGASYCNVCSPGSYSSNPGWTTCVACGAGRFQNESNRTGCTPCPPGSFGTALGLVRATQCIECLPGYYASDFASTSCLACGPGTFQTGIGVSLCGECRAGTYMAFPAWQLDPCTLCVSGTYSTHVGATGEEACSLCDDGLFSWSTGQNSSQTCKACPLGTVSISNKTGCVACPHGTYCPPGYHLPIQCFPGLICADGTRVEAPPGYLPILYGNCTGMIPCPSGTNCTISQGKGLLDPYPNKTHFIVFAGGNNQTDLSCPGATFEYGYDRVDWPYNASLYKGSLEILFWLTPLGCPSGTFLLDAACVPCPPGMYSISIDAVTIDACQPCPVGTHGPTAGATTCVTCQAGRFGNTSGLSSCPLCSSTQFSSAGDIRCSSCGLVKQLEPNQTCTTPRLPLNTSAIWLSVRGGGNTDDCIGIGQSKLSDNSSLLSMAVSMLNPRGQCDHVLHVMGRPDLSRSWIFQRTVLRRPAVLRVITHNETFYPALCARQGFGVVFTVEDEFGSMYTDLSAVKATIAILDSSGENQLFSMGCTRLPSSLTDPVPVGTCYTSYCPRTRVMVRVTITWNGGSVWGAALLGPGPSVWCGVINSWIAVVELVTPSVPYFPGELIRLYIRVLNSPAHLAVFRFALRMLPGVTFVSFQSVYSVVYQIEQDVISVVGDSSQGAGTVLGVLTLQVQATSMAGGVRMVAQVVPDTFQFTLPNTVPYNMVVRTHGFTCRSDGYLQVLTDTPRVTAIIARVGRSFLIHWRRIQSWSGFSGTTSVDTVAVHNTMKSYGLVVGQCTSLHPDDLVVVSCATILASGTGQGNAAASVRVQYQSASTLVNITVYVPQNLTIWTARSGFTGRFKVMVHLQAGNILIRDVDATPYVSPAISFTGPITIQNEQWTCASFSAASFTVGDPVLLTGTCNGGYDNSIPPVVFLFTGGVPGFGRFAISNSELSYVTATGGLLLLSGAHWLPKLSNPQIAAPFDRAVISNTTGGAWLGLVRSGASTRCVAVMFDAYTGFIPVFPPSPASLQLSLSATTLVSTNEPFTGLLPLSTTVMQAALVFSDGSTLDILADPRLGMTSMGPELLNISGLVATSGSAAGNTTLVFVVAGIPCVTTSIIVRVVAFSVLSSTITCSLCPDMLTTTADPLSMQFPVSYPSSVSQSLFIVRRVLADGTILRRFEPLHVSGNGVLVDGRLLGLSAGHAVLTTNHTDEPYLLPIVNRWAVSWRLLCNQRYVCAEDMKLAPPGDGAGLAPFGYTTQLALSLSLTLVNGNTANFSWLAGVTAFSNQTELVGAKEVPLLFGVLAVRAFFDDRWQLPESMYSLNFRVEKLASIMISGPVILYQMHCSLMWEEGNYTARGVLTDGVVRVIPAQFSGTVPVVIHDSQRGLAHADWVGTGQITAVFGARSGSIAVQATLSSKYFVSVGLDFLPSQWSVPLNQPLPAQPSLSPEFWMSPWFVLSNLTSRVLQWTTSAPDIIRVTPVALYLLADYYQPITVTVSLNACDGPVLSTTKDVVVNVIPNTPGQADFGQETGLPVTPVSAGQVMAVPVYIYAPARLRSYVVEIYLDDTIFESVDCIAGVLLNSQCAIVAAGPVFFRAVGAVLHSQMTGRILVGTVTGRPLRDAVVDMYVRVLQSVVGEQVLGSTEYVFPIRMGTGSLPEGYRYSTGTNPLATPIGYQSEAYGDADGDGFFTSLDVLFMEHYSAVAVFGGEQQICTVQGSCQLRSQLTAWQLMQLKPVRNPNVPATRPDGSDLLFMLRALVGKAYFLASLEVQSHPGSLSVRLSLRDHMQQVNPSNAAVQVLVSTVSNRDLAFDTPFEYNTQGGSITVNCKRVGQHFVISSLPTAVTWDETLVGINVITQALDRLGSQESALNQDRRFIFLPTSPVARFNVLASMDSLLPETPWLDYLPTTNCQTLCEDASLFLDNALGSPEWLNDTTVTSRFAMHPPSFQGFWPIQDNSWIPPPNQYSVSIPANIPPPDAILVGTQFNMTFQAPTGITMGVFQVEGAYSTLRRAFDGADAVGNVFFMHTERSAIAHLELRLDRPGIALGVRVFMLNAFPFEAFPPNSLAYTALVTGFVPVITSLRVEILCQSGVILWSVLGGTDEPCDVLLTPLWTPGPPDAPSSAGILVSCQSYPCILQGFSQTVRPAVQTYVPTKPRIMVQRALISLGQRVQWRAVCDLQGGPVNLTVTQRALVAGVIRISPANALVVTRDSIKGARLGRAVLRFGKNNNTVNASMGINVTSAANLPHSLTGFVFSGIGVSVSVNQAVTAVFQRGPLQTGQRVYLLIKAGYSGGYSMLIDPRPAPDGPTVVNASQDVVPSQLDGSVMIRKDAQTGSNLPIVTVVYQGLSLTIRADIVSVAPPVAPSSITNTTVVGMTTTTTTTTPALSLSEPNQTATPNAAGIKQITPGRLEIRLFGPSVSGFYIQIQIDGPVSIQGCLPGHGLPLFSDCVVSSNGGIMLTGASVIPLFNGTELAFVDFNGTYTGVWGFVEVHAGLISTRFPVYGATGPVDPIERLMPTLPTVDSTALYRRYIELFSPSNSVSHLKSPLYKAIFTLFLLTNKQRNVDARLYSNEFELSAMFRVMDRFLVPDINQTSSLVVMFHTDKLPALPGSTFVPGQGLQVPATHVLDGWYVVEWRQQIPVIDGLAVSFTLETVSLPYAWPWEVSDSLQTGLPLPSCPRAATDIGTFLMTYEIVADVPQALLDQIACSVQVAGRRVMLGPPDHTTGKRLLSIGLESLARVHQANLVVMSDWFARQLVVVNSSGNPILVQRGSLRYINDTRDPPIPCPQGFYYSKNGSYERLPMHAISGTDCYGLNCVGGYTLAPETQQCIPVPVSMDMVWVCVIVVMTVILAVSAVIFCVQLSAWGVIVEEVVLEPSAIEIPPCQALDPDDPNIQFQNIVTGIVLDDYSVMMLDDDFSAVPLDQD